MAIEAGRESGALAGAERPPGGGGTEGATRCSPGLKEDPYMDRKRDEPGGPAGGAGVEAVPEDERDRLAAGLSETREGGAETADEGGSGTAVGETGGGTRGGRVFKAKATAAASGWERAAAAYGAAGGGWCRRNCWGMKNAGSARWETEVGVSWTMRT